MTTVRRSILMAFAALTLTALSTVGAGWAQADTGSGPVHEEQSCTTFPGGSNDDLAVGGSTYNYASAVWHSGGDYLIVQDHISNGYRGVALFSYCVSGTWHPYLHLDSGPDEGDFDQEVYNFNFAEGRAIKFKVCEQRSGEPGSAYNCGDREYGHA